VKVVNGEVVRTDDLSTPALIICFRECLEGCVIVAVLLNMLHKAGMNDKKKWVWVGVIIASFAMTVLGVIAIVIWYQIQKTVPTSGRAAFEGVLATIACGILTLMALKFLRLKDLMFKWENKLFKDTSEAPTAEEVPSTEPKASCSCLQAVRDLMHIRHQAIARDDSGVPPKLLILLTFSAIFREGVETIVFLLPMSTGTTELGLLKGALAGCAAGIGFGILVLAVGKYMLLDISWFFNLTTAFILFIAAGLSNYAMIELEQIDVVGAKSRNDPIVLRPMYNIGCVARHPTVEVNCFLEEGTGAGLVFRALLGYRAAPTMLQCVAYLLYWQAIIALVVLRYKRGTLFSRTPPSAQSSPRAAVPNAVSLEEGAAGVSEQSAGAKPRAQPQQLQAQMPVVGVGMGAPMNAPVVYQYGAPMQVYYPAQPGAQIQYST